jgi:hypothetical protein
VGDDDIGGLDRGETRIEESDQGEGGEPAEYRGHRKPPLISVSVDASTVIDTFTIVNGSMDQWINGSMDQWINE